MASQLAEIADEHQPTSNPDYAAAAGVDGATGVLCAVAGRALDSDSLDGRIAGSSSA